MIKAKELRERTDKKRMEYEEENKSKIDYVLEQVEIAILETSGYQCCIDKWLLNAEAHRWGCSEKKYYECDVSVFIDCVIKELKENGYEVNDLEKYIIIKW